MSTMLTCSKVWDECNDTGCRGVELKRVMERNVDLNFKILPFVFDSLRNLKLSSPNRNFACFKEQLCLRYADSSFKSDCTVGRGEPQGG